MPVYAVSMQHRLSFYNHAAGSQCTFNKNYDVSKMHAAGTLCSNSDTVRWGDPITLRRILESC